jgi:hypothetical protein
MAMEQAAEREGSSVLTPCAKKFTRERIQQIINLVERGKSRDEIADILEVTAGSLEFTCSRLGISLRRPKIINGVCLLPKRKPLYENASSSPHPGDHDGRVPLQPTEKQSHENSTPDARSASFAIRFQSRGRERTAELPFTPHMIEQLALEAALQDVRIGRLIAELITAVARNKDLIPQVLNNTDPASELGGGPAGADVDRALRRYCASR